MAALIAAPNDAIMIPIPQYPLYSALITLYGGQQVGYYLDEESGWGFDLQVCVAPLPLDTWIRPYPAPYSASVSSRSIAQHSEPEV